MGFCAKGINTYFMLNVYLFTVSSWKLSRTRELSAQANAIITGIIADTQELLQEYYGQTSQTDDDCFYIPDVDETQAVVFRGQCENVAGMEGFSLQQVRNAKPK